MKHKDHVANLKGAGFGYGAGAFHVATLLAHPELQTDRADVAAVVLVSGIYRAGKDASDSEKAYLGSDAASTTSARSSLASSTSMCRSCWPGPRTIPLAS